MTRQPDEPRRPPGPAPAAGHFAPIAAGYAEFRPRYPAALFAWLASQAPARDVAWEPAAGSGQATTGLAAHFGRVVATDASAAQVARAPSLPNVTWGVEPAEASGLPDASVSLVAVAQAVHWLDHARFWPEARRVLRPGGVVAVWTYALFGTGDPAVDAVIDRFAGETLRPWWPPERRLVDDGLRSLAFPFEELPAPALVMEASWDVAHVMGYLRTWSAVTRWRAAGGGDPVAELAPALLAAWGSADATRRVTWPLALRAGRVR